MFTAEISALFEPQRILLRRVLMSLFSIAGLSWFLVFLPIVAMTPEKHAIFKANQYQLYLILLTLWGYDFRRQVKRLEWILELCSSLNKSASALSVADIQSGNGLSKMEVFGKHTGSSAQYFHILFTWLLLIFAVLQIVRQMILIFLL